MLDALEQLLQRTSPWVAVLLLLLFLVAGTSAGIAFARHRIRRRVATSRKLGRRGAARALRMLRGAGYRLEKTEVTGHGIVEVDGEDQAFVVRVDALVTRDGMRYAAEFKGGPASASVLHRDTRRQVLEYACVFDVDGVLLVDADADAGRIHRIRFPQGPVQ